ncbi:MAG TPA: hypothetical protein VLA97_09450, partial [Nocardioidaceae bacterium]|nr:hypothetical protein [Nocardioidaceae bacterium]
MSQTHLGVRPRRAALVLTAAALVLSGCGGQGPAEPRVTTGHGRPAAASSPTPAEKPASKPAPAAAASQEPSLPPGDPGLDAPSVPDPGVGSGEHAGHHEGRRTVPLSAMLTSGTVRMVAGGGWERRRGGGDECLRPEGARGLRTMTYGGTDAGVVVESVATYRDDKAADSATAAMAESAAGCGWEAAPDP